MKSNIINSKRYINNHLELSDTNYINSKQIKIENTLEVKQRHICRWDLISYEVYGDDGYGDLLFKFNEYSHPFEHKIGEIIIIPNLQQLLSNLTIDDFDNNFKQNKGIVTTQKVNETRLNYLKRKHNTPTKNTFKREINSDGTITIAK